VHIRPAVVCLSLLIASCGGSAASYTRFRHEAMAGRAPVAEEIRASDFVAYHAAADVPRAPASLPLGHIPGPATPSTLIEAQLGNPHLPAGSAAQPILQLALRGGTSALRYPAYVVVVVDVSGSMRDGDKIGAVRHALARFVETMHPEDRIAIVTFADAAHVALPPSRIAEARPVVLGAIGALEAYGGTNLEAGLRAGLDLAYGAEVGPTSVVRVLLLSDGVPSVGVMAPHAIVAGASRSDARGVPVTTIGMGDQIDYSLLDAIARRSGGAFHYLDRPSEVERLFATEIRAITEVAARDARVRVSLPPGWGLSRALDERTRIEGSELVTPLGDLGGGEASVVLAELSAPAAYGGEAIEARVEYVDPSGTLAILARVPVAVQRDGYLPYVDAPGGTVLRNASLARAALAMRDGAILRSRGDAASGDTMLAEALRDVCDARALLAARGEAELSRSLDEIAGLVAGIAPAPVVARAPTSQAFAGWRSEPQIVVAARGDACGAWR
jgi:Mg-chelatase subunit ChlD